MHLFMHHEHGDGGGGAHTGPDRGAGAR
jgi:hypothetical protein